MSTTSDETSFIAYIWYGDDEDSFLQASARNIPIFLTGGLLMVPLFNIIKKAMDRSKDPTGEKRITKIKKDVAAHGVQLSSSSGSGMSAASTPQYVL
jgi:hypothetical protein